ncbi:unnamed protein product [Rotaria sordida]|uniref:Uncharacterized protein n=1 Tax=Rotaria sordida TaxID=392033 RepID=A0A814KBQ5_9BILA|nr:unnamed protein product [Rotaria sordida]CAF1042447.1 unnamed protein product [Rotaria sordida]CAF1050443.1 unnamed protein product [Rotaria sordida]CAF1057759.1 unnamed protein product [Rotaria sordida]CAF1061217.1 unnamed protein product [Rotaria sordida]
MNNNSMATRSGFHVQYSNQYKYAYDPSPQLSINFSRPKPPSYSRAPWNVTKWIDPIEPQNRYNQRR